MFVVERSQHTTNPLLKPPPCFIWLYIPLMNLSLWLSNPALSVKKTCEWKTERDRRKQEGSFSFLLHQELIIPESLFCLKCTSPKLLHFFVPALPTHKPTLWLAVFSPTLAPPRVLWLALLFSCPRYDIPPSFLLLSLLLIPDCVLQPVCFQRAPRSRSSFSGGPSSDQTSHTAA